MKATLLAPVLRGGRHPDETRPFILVADDAGDVARFEAAGPGWWGNAGDVFAWDRLVDEATMAEARATVAAFLTVMPAELTPLQGRTWRQRFAWTPERGWFDWDAPLEREQEAQADERSYT
jgi:hypothetical protein